MRSPVTGPRFGRLYQAGIRIWSAAIMGVVAATLFLVLPVVAAEAQQAQQSQEAPVSATVRVGDDVFAGDGCVRAGNVVVGNCDEVSENSGKSGETGVVRDEKATPDKETSGTTIENAEAPAPAGGTTSAGEASVSPDGVACPTGPPEDARTATVGRVIDGDTVELEEPVDGYDTVRLIGVNTPEMDGGENGPETGAEEATKFTAEALEGREVTLETDEEIEDQYSRLLAYVWLDSGSDEPEFFNKTLLDEGLAQTLTVEPNDAYAECLDAAEEEARKADEKNSNEGLLGRIRDLLPSETEPEDGPETPADEPAGADDQYETREQTGPGDEPAEMEPETKEEATGEEVTSGGSEPETPTETPTEEITQGDQEETTEFVAISDVPPEECPGASVVLESFGSAEAGQSPPFKITGGAFVVRADLRSEDGTEVRLDVALLDTETQEPVEEFDQRAVGSYDTVVNPGPGEYLLELTPAGPSETSYEVAVFDCADEQASETPSSAPEKEGKSGPTPPEQGPEEPQEEPAEPAQIELPKPEPEPGPETGPEVQPVDPEPAESGPVEPERPELAVALPTEDTPEGEVEVLPDTGGPPLSPAILAAGAAVATFAGGAMLLMLRRLHRNFRATRPGGGEG